ncbi:MAG: sigma 54-interacting transcriptional regulator [Thermodesulfobacteriota bacterium]
MGQETLDILLIEDEEAHAEAVMRAFKQMRDRANLTWAPSLQDALARLASSTPDLVITDWILPDGKGTDVLPVDEDIPQFPVILMTAYGNEKVAVDAMKAGVVDYVVKSPAAFANMPNLAERVLREWNLFAERKRAEDALRESEERFRAIFTRATDHIFVKDREGRYLQVNPAFESLVGYSAGAIIGRTAADLFGKESGKAAQERDARVLQGEVLEGERTESIHGARVILSYSLSPLRDASGHIVGIFGITRDITDRKRFELPGEDDRDPIYPSKAMRLTLKQATAAARKNTTILLLGETGSGKDWLAKYIHNRSDRASDPYLALNCAAIAPNLAESELFGHEKGAFTGAAARKRGALELAEGATLLLNEIGELTLPLQAKLLTFLDMKRFTRVGGEKEIRVNVRIIAATNRDLEKEVQEARFRADLFYRLNVLAITVPPLRERREDIPALAQEILSQLATHMQLTSVPALDSIMMDALTEYDWPGNVRELKNVLERALILRERKDADLILPAFCQDRREEDEALTIRFRGRTLRDVTDEITRSMCWDALQQCNGNKKEAAKALGIARDSLYRYLKEFGIADTSKEEDAVESKTQ